MYTVLYDSRRWKSYLWLLLQKLINEANRRHIKIDFVVTESRRDERGLTRISAAAPIKNAPERNLSYLDLVTDLSRGAQMAARGPEQARRGLQSGPRRLFEVNNKII